MQKTELMIGNLVLNDGVVNEIVGILCDDICTLRTPQNNYIHARYELIKPIQLTEEWLLNFGLFRVITNNYSFDKATAKNMKVSSASLTTVDKKEWRLIVRDENITGSSLLIGKRIAAVHELQNLYFVLTGQKILIKKSDNLQPKIENDNQHVS